MKWDVVAMNIMNELQDYVEGNKLQSLVLGISGGIDSALCAALARPVCERLDIPLIGHSLPIHSKMDEVRRAEKVGRTFCTEFEEVLLFTVFEEFIEENHKGKDETDLEYRIRMGNIKARLRMIHLFDLAQKRKGMVLSTDNYTELQLGFSTLHGDVGNYGLIQYLWKTEIYDFSAYLVKQFSIGKKEKEMDIMKSCIDAVPTDGNGVTNSDLDQLGVDSYKEVDSVLQEWFIEGPFEKQSAIYNHPVIQRHLKTQFKRDDPVNIKRVVLLKGAIQAFIWQGDGSH